MLVLGIILFGLLVGAAAQYVVGRNADGVDWSLDAVHTLTHDPFLVHFIHRWWAWVAVIALVIFARSVRRLDRRASIAIHSAFGIQILLGIATVLTGVAVSLAVLHQAVGAALVAATVWGAHVHGSGPR